MTTKKKDVSTEKATAKKAAKKAATKRVTRIQSDNNSTSRGIKPGNNDSFPPEVLADLAVKLVRSKRDAPTNNPHSSPPLSSPAFDAEYADALKRAEMLLLAASGKSDEDIHAYQLFTESDGLMSFEEVAARFKEVGWKKMVSGNTVTPVIEKLVIKAEFEVQKERERNDKLISVRRRYPGGLYSVVDRVRRHIRNMIRRTDLRDLFDHPEQVADAMGNNFLRLMENKILCDWERDLSEEFATAMAFESFIEYVCGGLNYESFIKDPPIIWMDLERLGSLIFFLECLGEKGTSQPQITEEKLRSLMRLILGRSDVPTEAISDINACLGELKKANWSAERFKELASGAGLMLRKMWEHWYLIRLGSAQGLSDLIGELKDSKSALNSADRFSTTKVAQILELLVRANELGKAEGASMEAGEIRQLLDDLKQRLEDSDLIAAAKVQAQRFEGTIADEMKKVAGGFAKGLQMKPPAKRHAQRALDDLLLELKPYSGERKCRPYELFLFAAQKHLLEDKLVRKRNALNAEFRPYPPYPYRSLSILESHRGAEIAMGIE